MGPIALFDKSFLQCLNLDEAVWFDGYFFPVVCPLFYVETLADLSLTSEHLPAGRSAEREVSGIARKTPELSGGPVAFHQQLYLQDLLGAPVPMNSQIPRPGGRVVGHDGKMGVVYGESLEEKAFDRWQRGEYRAVERQAAQQWRKMLANLDLSAIAGVLRERGVGPGICKTLEQAKSMAESIIESCNGKTDQMRLVFAFVELSREDQYRVMVRWNESGRPPLRSLAPYAAYVLTVDLFFQISLAAGLITDTRPSNRIDIAYLYYLPFCMLFISGDKLHRRSAPLFLRDDQEFVWGFDLKDELRRINEHFSALPEAERDLGVMRLARKPVGDDSSLMVRLWDRFFSGWRRSSGDEAERMTDEARKELVARVEALHSWKDLPANEAKAAEPDMLSIERKVHKRRGSWYQVPKDLKEDGRD